MFYVGDILWLEEGEWFQNIPNCQNFSGCLHYPNGTKVWYDEGIKQSPQDPETGEWLPAVTFSSGARRWYNKGLEQSFQDPKTKEWIPAEIASDGRKYWFDKGEWVDPETHSWKEG